MSGKQRGDETVVSKKKRKIVHESVPPTSPPPPPPAAPTPPPPPPAAEATPGTKSKLVSWTQEEEIEFVEKLLEHKRKGRTIPFTSKTATYWTELVTLLHCGKPWVNERRLYDKSRRLYVKYFEAKEKGKPISSRKNSSHDEIMADFSEKLFYDQEPPRKILMSSAVKSSSNGVGKAAKPPVPSRVVTVSESESDSEDERPRAPPEQARKQQAVPAAPNPKGRTGEPLKNGKGTTGLSKVVEVSSSESDESESDEEPPPKSTQPKPPLPMPRRPILKKPPAPPAHSSSASSSDEEENGDEEEVSKKDWPCAGHRVLPQFERKKPPVHTPMPSGQGSVSRGAEKAKGKQGGARAQVEGDFITALKVELFDFVRDLRKECMHQLDTVKNELTNPARMELMRKRQQLLDEENSLHEQELRFGQRFCRLRKEAFRLQLSV